MIDMFVQTQEHAKYNIAQHLRDPLRFQNAATIIGRFPNEIWLHIFEMGVRDEIVRDSEDDVYYYNRTSLMYSITSTCTHWREMSRGCSVLWRNVNFTVDSDYVSSFYTLRDRLQLSNLHKIAVNMFFEEAPPRTVKKAIRYLRAHSHRCGNLLLEIHSPRNLANTVSPLQGSFRSLRVIHVDIQQRGNGSLEGDGTAEPVALLENGSDCHPETLSLHTPESWFRPLKTISARITFDTCP